MKKCTFYLSLLFDCVNLMENSVNRHAEKMTDDDLETERFA